MIGDLDRCCHGKTGGRVLFPSCNLRYELYPFYEQYIQEEAEASTPPLLPPPTDSLSDSNLKGKLQLG